MNELFAGYTPYQGGLMQSFAPDQNINPAMMNDSAIQKLLQAQVQQQLLANFSPQDQAGQDAMTQMLASGGAGKGGAAPVVPTTPTVPTTPAAPSKGDKKGNGGGGSNQPQTATPYNPMMTNMEQYRDGQMLRRVAERQGGGM